MKWRDNDRQREGRGGARPNVPLQLITVMSNDRLKAKAGVTVEIKTGQQGRS